MQQKLSIYNIQGCIEHGVFQFGDASDPSVESLPQYIPLAHTRRLAILEWIVNIMVVNSNVNIPAMCPRMLSLSPGCSSGIVHAYGYKLIKPEDTETKRITSGSDGDDEAGSQSQPSRYTLRSKPVRRTFEFNLQEVALLGCPYTRFKWSPEGQNSNFCATIDHMFAREKHCRCGCPFCCPRCSNYADRCIPGDVAKMAVSCHLPLLVTSCQSGELSLENLSMEPVPTLKEVGRLPSLPTDAGLARARGGPGFRVGRSVARGWEQRTIRERLHDDQQRQNPTSRCGYLMRSFTERRNREKLRYRCAEEMQRRYRLERAVAQALAAQNAPARTLPTSPLATALSVSANDDAGTETAGVSSSVSPPSSNDSQPQWSGRAFSLPLRPMPRR